MYISYINKDYLLTYLLILHIQMKVKRTCFNVYSDLL